MNELWHPCRLDFTNCSYTIADGSREDCADCGTPPTPSAPVTSSNRPGADVKATPGVEALPQPPPGVSDRIAKNIADSEAAVAAGQPTMTLDDVLAEGAQLAKLRQRWGRWEERTWNGMSLDLAVWYANSLNEFPDFQVAYNVDCDDGPHLYVRRALP